MIKKHRTILPRRTLVLFAAALAPMSTQVARCAIDDSWTNTFGGTWDLSTNWSLGVAPVTSTYNGIIAVQPANPYTVNIVDNISPASITLNSTKATILHSGGTVTTASINIQAGTYTLNAGTFTDAVIANATVNQAGGTFNLLDGTLNNVTVIGDLLLPSRQALGIQNGLTISSTNKNLNVGNNATIYLSGNQTLNNINVNSTGSGPGSNAIINFGTSSSSTATTVGTLSSSASINGPFEIFNANNSVANSLINNGTINSNSSGNATYIETTSCTNNNLVEATAGGTLEIDSTNFTNNGTIHVAAGSKLSISSPNFVQSGTFTTDAGSQTSVVSGTSSFSGGTVQNGGSLTVSTATGGATAVIQSTVGVTVGGPVILAPFSSDKANYTVSSGSLTAQQGAMIGAVGSGSFTQSGGTSSFTGALSAGNSGTLTSGSGTGIINVSGGSLYADTVLLGAVASAGGSGAMTVSGSGNVTIGGGAHLNDLTVNGGFVTVLNQTPPANEDHELNYALVGGYLSNGALYVNGGTVTTPDIKLGISSGYTGTYAQTAGTVNVGTLALGNDASLTTGSGVGSATISGGSLFVNTLLIGAVATAGGTGALIVSGTGSVTIAGGAHLNDLTVNAGAVTVLDQMPPPLEDSELNRALVGGYLSNGALIVNGGVVTTPYIKLGVSSGETGTFSQTAGTVSVGTLCVGDDVLTTSGTGVGSTILSGGAVSIGTLLVGSTAGGVGAVAVSGTAAVRITKALTLISGHSGLGLAGGTLTLDAAPASLASDAIPVGDGTHAAELHLHNTTLTGSGASLTIAAHAALDGGGGDLAGETTGTVNFVGTSLTLSGSNSTLHLAIGGSAYDQITESSGILSVGSATLQILPLSGIVLNQKYPVIIANTATGGVLNYTNQMFSNLTTDPTYTAGVASYYVTYAPSEIDVTFTSTVPEPTSTIVGMILGYTTLRRRRKTTCSIARYSGKV